MSLRHFCEMWTFDSKLDYDCINLEPKIQPAHQVLPRSRYAAAATADCGNCRQHSRTVKVCHCVFRCIPQAAPCSALQRPHACSLFLTESRESCAEQPESGRKSDTEMQRESGWLWKNEKFFTFPKVKKNKQKKPPYYSLKVEIQETKYTNIICASQQNQAGSTS